MSNEIVLVIGERNAGKTTTLLRLLQHPEYAKRKVCGIIALANPEKTWYRLKSLTTNQSRLAFSCETRFPHERRLGRFFVDEDAFAWANAHIIGELPRCELVVFDEIGRLELQGGGLAPALRQALDRKTAHILATVRTPFVDEVLKTFAIPIEYVTKVMVDREKDDANHE